MITPKAQLIAQKINQLCGIDISKGWPDDMSFQLVTKILFYGLAIDKRAAFVEALELATLNGEIPARREGYHEYEYPMSGGKQKQLLQQNEILKLELELKLDLKPKAKRVAISTHNSQAIVLYEHAKLIIGTRSIGETWEWGKCNEIHINWHYTLQDLIDWFARVEEEPTEFLNAWISSKKNIEVKEIKTNMTNNLAAPRTEQCLPNFPGRQDTLALVIRDTVEKFIANHKSCPNRQQIWGMLRVNPVTGYDVKQATDRGEEALLIDGELIARSAFDKRWERYTLPKKI